MKNERIQQGSDGEPAKTWRKFTVFFSFAPCPIISHIESGLSGNFWPNWLVFQEIAV
jgi:hypothetical protein